MPTRRDYWSTENKHATLIYMFLRQIEAMNVPRRMRKFLYPGQQWPCDLITKNIPFRYTYMSVITFQIKAFFKGKRPKVLKFWDGCVYNYKSKIKGRPIVGWRFAFVFRIVALEYW